MKPTVSASALLAIAFAGLGCDSTIPAPEGPRSIRGVVFTRKLVTADSVRLAQYGQVISVVRSDSVIVLLTNADGLAVVSSLGIAGMCQPLGSDSSASVEVEIGAGPQRIDSATAVVAKLGRVHLVDSSISIVDGMVPAFRLHEFDDHPVLTYVYVVVCPYFQS